MGPLDHLMAAYANALAISLLAIALIVLGLKDQRCEQQPSRATTSTQSNQPQSNPLRPVVTQNQRELSKF